MVKCVSILGSTGSIGRQSLDIIDNLNIPVAALTAGTSVERMAQQCRDFMPELAVMATAEAAEALSAQIKDLPIRVSWGEEGLIEAATIENADCVITAVVGMVGLKPTLAAFRAGKRIGLANKETLVCAGELVMAEAKKYGTEIIPVDSEHSAIFQCLQGSKGRHEVRKIILTASGGPFYGKSCEDLLLVTREQALKHPNWAMGAKITIDSASMMNKGFEVIEARWLFDIPVEKIQVLVHPQSVIHSAVQFVDGSVKAQLGTPDMRMPIQYALTYPERWLSDVPRLDLFKTNNLTFEEPDLQRFPNLRLAYQAMEQGGNMPCILNAANEVVNLAFREGRCGFLQMSDIIEQTMTKTTFITEPTYDNYVQTDQEARKIATELLKL